MQRVWIVCKRMPGNVIRLVPANSKILFLCNYQDLRDMPRWEKCDSGCTRCRKYVKMCPTGAVIWNKDKSMAECRKGFLLKLLYRSTMDMNSSTNTGSNCTPAQALSSLIAVALLSSFLYGLPLRMTSKVSMM
jgi:ferredoxin